MSDEPPLSRIYRLAGVARSRGGARRLARLDGTLVGFLVGDTVWMWAATMTGLLIPLRWPEGYKARYEPIEIVDDKGRTVARGGQKVTLGGGYTTQDSHEESLQLPPPFSVHTAPVAMSLKP